MGRETVPQRWVGRPCHNECAHAAVARWSVLEYAGAADTVRSGVPPSPVVSQAPLESPAPNFPPPPAPPEAVKTLGVEELKNKVGPTTGGVAAVVGHNPITSPPPVQIVKVEPPAPLIGPGLGGPGPSAPPPLPMETKEPTLPLTAESKPEGIGSGAAAIPPPPPPPGGMKETPPPNGSLLPTKVEPPAKVEPPIAPARQVAAYPPPFRQCRRP